MKNINKIINEVIDKYLTEEGEGGMGSASVGGGLGGSTSSQVMQGGGSNPSAGQIDVPLGSIQRKKFWYSGNNSKTMGHAEDESNDVVNKKKQVKESFDRNPQTPLYDMLRELWLLVIKFDEIPTVKRDRALTSLVAMVKQKIFDMKTKMSELETNEQQ